MSNPTLSHVAHDTAGHVIWVLVNKVYVVVSVMYMYQEVR